MACLDQHFAWLGSAPCAACHLRDLLIGPFRRAQVPAFEAEIGIDHTHQREFGEMEPFRHQLRAHDHVDLPRFGKSDEFGCAFGRVERVRSRHRHARFGHQFGHFIRDPFHSGAAGDEAIFRSAFGAGGRRRGFVAAMVTGEPLGKAMFDQPGAAIGTLETIAAMAAKRQRSIAAPVEEQQRLLPAFGTQFELFNQFRCEPAPARRRIGAPIAQVWVGAASKLRKKSSSATD